MARYRDYADEDFRRGVHRPSDWEWGRYYGAPAGWPPYEPYAYPPYDYRYVPRLPPEQSPTYGRGGDRAIRRWAQRHGYDAGYVITPRHRPRGRRHGRHGRPRG
ncbi:MAG TPA: hypothetical protein VF188_16935 [Longimicrobiales bacterium]